MQPASNPTQGAPSSPVGRLRTYTPIAARAAPIGQRGVLHTISTHLFPTRTNGVVTLALLLLGIWLVYHFWGWGIQHAVFAAHADSCQAARGLGACWGVIVAKGRFIFMGRYPELEQWRPVLATSLLLATVIMSCMPRFWRPRLAVIWGLMLPLYFMLMRGGVLGLSLVDTDLWGGFPLTVLLTVISMVLAFPLSIVVALGRRSDMPAIQTLCTLYVELIRGIPLISVLFMASFMIPLFMPEGVNIDVLIRVIIGITLFSAAYMAEIVRGGLQALPKGQVEAAATLGLSYWQTQRKVVLPQALATVVPSLMNNFISVFKDTSLVTIVAMYELTGALQLAVSSDVNWRPFKIEAYLFIAFVYFVCCFSMSRYSLWIEQRLGKSKNS